ncbi:MAG: hypothetical protein AAF288_09570 [Planctomycetota bacterium]
MATANRNPFRTRVLLTGLLAAGLPLSASAQISPREGADPAPAPAVAETEAPANTGRTDGSPVIRRGGATGDQPALEGYDFQQVFTQMRSSVNPLQREMNSSFRVFGESVERAEKLLEEGKTEEALEEYTTAIEGVLRVRDDVLDPMWEAQGYLGEQTSYVRGRLGEAIEAGDADQGEGENAEGPAERSERMLDMLARQVAAEKDPVRQKRLVMQYKTLREIARVRSMSRKLTPNQRKLWDNVLRVLDEVSLAHQQVILNTELLFVRFEAAGQSLNDNLTLMETMRGAKDLLGLVDQAGGEAGAMAQFGEELNSMQSRLDRFNGNIEAALDDSITDLEGAIDAVAGPDALDRAPAGVEDLGDDELSRRIREIEAREATP